MRLPEKRNRARETRIIVPSIRPFVLDGDPRRKQANVELTLDLCGSTILSGRRSRRECEVRR